MQLQPSAAFGTACLLLITATLRQTQAQQPHNRQEDQDARDARSVSSADAQVPFDGSADATIPGVTQTAGLSAADFDSDGRIDLAVLSGESARLVILLNGADAYRIAGEMDAGASASNCVAADFNGDGKIDLAVPHHDTDEVWLFLAKGTGAFQAPTKIRVAVSKPHLHMLAAGDVNGDQRTDLLLAQADENGVWVLLGDGNGDFAPSSGSPFPTGNHPYIVTASDLNGDGNLDFATPNWYGKSLSIFLGDGTGDFTQAPGSPISGFSAPTALAAADLNDDGKVDLAVGNDDSSRVQILIGDGKGSFEVGAVPDLEAKEDCLARMVADLTGDGKPDVIATAVNDARTFTYWINRATAVSAPVTRSHALRWRAESA